MRNVRRIAVISRDTLRAAGLRNLLVSYFAPVETDLFSDPDTERRQDYDYYFLDGEWSGHLPAFPRGRVMVLSATGMQDPQENVLDTTADLHRIVEEVGAFFDRGNPDETGKRNNALSEREVQVLRWVVSGAINKEIADRLSISFNTVLTHRKNIAAKTGIKTVSGLTFYALLNGYVSPSDIEF